MTDSISDCIARARNGDLDALETLIRTTQDRVYNLALRMLSDPEDAHDATQEILVKITTNLATFRGDSAFSTWVYRVAANHLLTTRKRRAERREQSFAQLGEQIVAGLASAAPSPDSAVDDALLSEEIRLGCALGMLQCLDRPHRLAVILGEIIKVSSEEGGAILDISAAAYRQRLARGRRSLVAFMRGTCGLVNPANPCRCHKQIPATIAVGRLDPQHLRFADHPTLDFTHALMAGFELTQIEQARMVVHNQEASQLDRAAAVLRSHPAYAAPETFVHAVRRLIESGELTLLR